MIRNTISQPGIAAIRSKAPSKESTRRGGGEAVDPTYSGRSRSGDSSSAGVEEGVKAEGEEEKWEAGSCSSMAPASSMAESSRLDSCALYSIDCCSGSSSELRQKAINSLTSAVRGVLLGSLNNANRAYLDVLLKEWHIGECSSDLLS